MRRSVGHGVLHLGLNRDHANALVLAIFDLFVLLDKITRSATARAETVCAAIALQSILLANFTTLHHLYDPVAPTAGQGVVAAAVSIEEAPSLQLRVFVEAMMLLRDR
jgi:nitric oxide reductase large subunit